MCVCVCVYIYIYIYIYIEGERERGVGKYIHHCSVKRESMSISEKGHFYSCGIVICAEGKIVSYVDITLVKLNKEFTHCAITLVSYRKEFYTTKLATLKGTIWKIQNL